MISYLMSKKVYLGCPKVAAHGPQVRQKAAESLASLCKGDRLAQALAKNLMPMLQGNSMHQWKPLNM